MLEANEKAIMKSAMREREMTQAKLAEKMGTSQNNLSACLNRSRTSVDVFKDVLDTLEYDVVIVDRRTGKAAFRLEM